MEKCTYENIDSFINELRITLKLGKEKYGDEYLRQDQSAYIREKIARIGTESREKSLEDIVEIAGYSYLWWDKLYTGYTPSIGALYSLTGETAFTLQKEGLVETICPIKANKYDIDSQFKCADHEFLTHGITNVLLLGCMYKVPEWFLQRYDVFNLHPGLLPLQGGKDPHIGVIANEDPCTGVTIHKVTNVIDSGPILAQLTILVHSADTPDTLYKRLKQTGLQLTRQFIRSYLA